MQMRAREADTNANTQQELVHLLLAETVIIHFDTSAVYMYLLLCSILSFDKEKGLNIMSVHYLCMTIAGEASMGCWSPYSSFAAVYVNGYCQ